MPNNLLTIYLLVLLIISVCILIYYYLFYFLKLGVYPEKQENNQSQLPISIIIAARNEYKNLEKYLKSILEQDYQTFEVVVVNDCSWDESQKLLEYYQEVYPHLNICTLKEQEKYPTGKKFALTIGIKAAKHQNLLFTDADCKPASNQWLRLMAEKFNSENQIVIGYSPYIKHKGFLNRMARFENAVSGILYLSAAINKNTFMGVGRNLAYTKDLFFKHKGFASHQHILSGDDDLFVNEAATPNNVAIQINPSSFVFTETKKTFSDWAWQKRRHNTTGKHYKLASKIYLGIFYASNLFFYTLLIGLLIYNLALWPVLLGVYGLKLLTQTVSYYLCFKKLNQQNLTWSIALFDFLYVVYVYIFGTLGLIAKQNKRW
jgi:glycosyltransferase involved in cell wall biosynthesis